MKQSLLVSILTSVLLCACEPSSEIRADAIGNEETVRRYWNGKWNERNPAILDELLTPDHSYHGPGSETFGREEYAELYATFFNAITETRLTIDHLLAAGDEVASWVTITGVHSGDLPDIPATGRSISLTLSTVFRFEDGRIAEEFETYNELDLLTQLGVTVFASE